MRLLLPIIFLAACSKTPPPRGSVPVPVTTIKVAPKTIPADFEYIGVGESSHIVQIRARVEGYLESINYREGGLVQAGELMFVLDQRPFIAKLDHAKADVDRQVALLTKAQQTKNRMIPLYQKNAVSQRDYDDAIDDELASEANLAASQADLYQAQINLGFTSISAPVTGLASQAQYREGALIAPGGGDQNLLTTIYVVDPIWVNFNVSESDILRNRKLVSEKRLQWPDKMNFQVEAILGDGTVVPAEGYIDFTNPALQQTTGTMLVRSILPNPKLLIYPGQFVRVRIKGATYPNAILVPQTAVIQGASGTFVYVVEGNIAKTRPVVTGDWYQSDWIIIDGLKEGDIVITQGVNKIQNNSPVIEQ